MEQLRNVLWVGGVAGAGKSTVARRLARRHGLRRYNPDAQTWRHLDRALAAGSPGAEAFARMTPAERAAAMPEKIDYDREPMVVDDLSSMPAAPLIVAELVPPYPAIAPSGQAVCLTPSPEVQRARLERRHPGGVPTRYLLGRQSTEDKRRESGAHVIVVDDLTVDDVIAEVERHFAKRLTEGPTAVTPDERRDVLRDANEALVAQHLGWAAHTPGGEVSGSVRPFDCECGESTCMATVDLSISDAGAAMTSPPPAIMATGHRPAGEARDQSV